MLTKLLSSVRNLSTFTNIYTSLVLVALALATYYLERSISRREVATGLHQAFIASDTTKSLQKLSFRAAYQNWNTPSESLAYLSVLANRLKNHPLETRRSVAQFLEEVTIVQLCRERDLCDPRTIDIFFQTPISEIFFFIRPLIYCDDFIREKFGTSYFDNENYVEKVESLMMHLLEEEQSAFKYGTPIPIYRNSKFLEEAQATGKISKNARPRPFVVAIDSDGTICEKFNSQLKD